MLFAGQLSIDQFACPPSPSPYCLQCEPDKMFAIARGYLDVVCNFPTTSLGKTCDAACWSSSVLTHALLLLLLLLLLFTV
jgi:hypothetical protein